jgi:hypothetical protein
MSTVNRDIQIPKGLIVPPLTRLTRKRLYIPQVDVSENPFCQSRQLMDKVTSIQRKPPMVVEVEVALAKLSTKSTLPTSVFAPAKDELTRSRNNLFGTVEGAEYIMSQRASTTEEKIGDDGPGIFVPDPNDVFAPPDKTYFPDPFEVATNLVTKPPALTDIAKPTTYGHRPRSASRHFDPLTMSANRFGRTAKNLPQAGLLSAADLHKMLKHGQDVVGMGPSHAEQGLAPLDGSTSTLSPRNSDTVAPGSTVVSAGGTQPVPPQQQRQQQLTGGSTLDGTSQYGDSVDLMIRPEVTQRTTGKTIMEREAPMGLVQAPGWMGGVYSTGLGKSLFDKTTTQKLEAKARRKKKKVERRHRNGRPTFNTKIYYPPPQRAFRSQLQEDDFALMTSKEKLSRFSQYAAGSTKLPTCELRQKIDSELAKDSMNRILANRRSFTRREYTTGGVSSTTPRKKFTHNITEIEKEVERRLRMGMYEEDDDEVDVDDDGESDAGGGVVVSSEQYE